MRGYRYYAATRLRRRGARRPTLSRHVQRSSHRIGERPGDAHGIILLQARDGFAYFWCKQAVDWAAIIAQPAQGGLHGTHVSGLQNELFVSLKVINPSPLVAWCEVSRIYILSLVE